MILILSSFVASSPVGGGAQAVALAKLEVETVLAPTVLLGRHPGLGPPGGGAVDPSMFESVLAGIEANGVFAAAEAVICGYFADPAQVAAAARTIDAVKAARPSAMIVVDPIMGDSVGGLYVKPEVARALAVALVPRADLIAPNAWELGRLTGTVVGSPAEALAAARELGRPALVSSIPVGRAIGVMWTDGDEAWLAVHGRAAIDPKGAGDLLTALFTAAVLGGASPAEALETAVGDVTATVLSGEVDISLEALHDR
ncbi:MAG TPA: PfkB family carbohydrate kinase [Caulobacteraceae bacterium]|nr:PfkB family carbohydrate kinase [Caulobacteraceae bacterium]